MRWYEVSEGLLTEKEIHDLQFQIRQKKGQSLYKHLGGSALPEKPKLLAKANQLADIYYDNFYSVEKQ
jgi:hypothetical protein